MTDAPAPAAANSPRLLQVLLDEPSREPVLGHLHERLRRATPADRGGAPRWYWLRAVRSLIALASRAEEVDLVETLRAG